MESDLVDFSSGSTYSAINFGGSTDLHTPIHPPPLFGWVNSANLAGGNTRKEENP